MYRLLGDVGHEAHDGEDDQAGEHAGTGVDAAHDQGVPKGGWGGRTEVTRFEEQL